MSPIFHLLFLVFSFVCFALATFPQANPNWNRLVSAGLAFLVASMVSW